MNDKTNPFADFDWLEAQRNYMNALASLGRNTGTKPDSEIPNMGDIPWAQALEFWWKSVKGVYPDDTRDFFGNVVDQTKIFYLVSEQMSKYIRAVTDINKASEDWQERLSDQFKELKSFFSSQVETANGMNGMLGSWHLLPMDTMQRTFSSASFMPGDFFQDFKHDGIQNITDKFLSVPGVGYTRESQEQVQEGLKLWNAYQNNMQEYNSVLCGVAVKALESMHAKILEIGKEGKEIRNLREIYDLWVDCNEDAYAELVFSEDYSKLYGRLVNSLMAVKQYGQNVVDESLAAMNMPTRRGLNTVKKRQQEFRRELSTIKIKYDKNTRHLQRMENQLASLKGELELLKSGGKGSHDKKKGSSVSKKNVKQDTSVPSMKERKKAKKKISANKKIRSKKKVARRKAGNKTAKDKTIVIKI